jgi:hypothetical protein
LQKKVRAVLEGADRAEQWSLSGKRDCCACGARTKANAQGTVCWLFLHSASPCGHPIVCHRPSSLVQAGNALFEIMSSAPGVV